MKYLILVGDGMGDYPLEKLGGKTVLEAAHTPMMDKLCQLGELYLAQTVPEGYSPGSDVANLSLAGYDPVQYFTGRAPLEAAAMRVNLDSDETAFRCNLVNLDFTTPNGPVMADFSAGHISSQEAAEIISSLNDHCNQEIFRFYPGVSYRHLLTVKGPIPPMNTVPPHDHIDEDISTFRQEYLNDQEWADLITKTDELLANHPVNLQRKEQGQLPATAIWLWGEGKMPEIPSLTDRFGITGSMISAVDLLKGIGVLAGLDIINVPGATGYLDTNYAGKAQAAINGLKTQDFTFVHVEAPDEAGHEGSMENKITAIEDFDKKIVCPIIEELRQQGEDFRVVVTMDHFTPITLRTHSTDPVPALLYDSRENTKGCNLPFCEQSTHNDATRVLDDGYTLINKLLEKHT